MSPDIEKIIEKAKLYFVNNKIIYGSLIVAIFCFAIALWIDDGQTVTQEFNVSAQQIGTLGPKFEWIRKVYESGDFVQDGAHRITISYSHHGSLVNFFKTLAASILVAGIFSKK